MNELMEIKIQGYQIIEKTIKSSGNSGRVYVPKGWVGKKVKIVLLESATDDNNETCGMCHQKPTTA